MECEIHGSNEPAILCQHLAHEGMAEDKFTGWLQAAFDPENREPGDLMAWCLNCDKVYEADNGWNEQNDKHFKVVCELCFLAIQQNQKQLSPQP